MIVLKVITAVVLVIFLTYVATDTLQNKRMKKLKNTIAFLKDCRKADAKDYRAMYQRVLILDMKVNELEKENEELRKENEELKKQLDKQENVTYNYYINK